MAAILRLQDGSHSYGIYGYNTVKLNVYTFDILHQIHLYVRLKIGYFSALVLVI